MHQAVIFRYSSNSSHVVEFTAELQFWSESWIWSEIQIAGISGSIYAIYNRIITLFQQYFNAFLFEEGAKPQVKKNRRTGLDLYHNNEKIWSTHAWVTEHLHSARVGVSVDNRELSKQKDLIAVSGFINSKSRTHQVILPLAWHRHNSCWNNLSRFWRPRSKRMLTNWKDIKEPRGWLKDWQTRRASETASLLARISFIYIYFDALSGG